MNIKNSISILQELTIQKYNCYPKYDFEDRTQGSSRFACICTLNNKQTVEIASSKKEAKLCAATKMLAVLGLSNDISPTSSIQPSSTDIKPILSTSTGFEDEYNIDYNAIGVLGEYCAKHGYEYPAYQEMGVDGSFFVIQCSHHSLSTEGRARNKKEAKKLAAHKMVQIVNSNSNYGTPTSKPIAANKSVEIKRKFPDTQVVAKYNELSVQAQMMMTPKKEMEPKSQQTNPFGWTHLLPTTDTSPVPSPENFALDYLRPSLNSSALPDSLDSSCSSASPASSACLSESETSLSNNSQKLLQLKQKLKELGIIYTVNVINQAEPCMLMFKNKDKSSDVYDFLEVGNNYEETLVKLFETALDCFDGR